MVADPENPKNTGYNLFTSGLVYAQQGISDDVNPGWKMKVDTTGEGQISENTFDTDALSENIDVISGTTIAIYFYPNMTGEEIIEDVYFPYDEDLSELEYTSNINIFPRTMKGLQIGSGARERYGGCFYNAVITGVRIFDDNIRNGARSYDCYINQGDNIVHANDSVDSIKQYVKVKATYDNGYTSFIDEDMYTLYGTLSEPVSNISINVNNRWSTTYVGYVQVLVGNNPTTGIAAFFEQEENNIVVHTTDTLESIKHNLLVIAYVRNNTEIVVRPEDYILSGTLIEGTSTITVSYRGHTATFDVEVVT